jgi:hypothetical protein
VLLAAVEDAVELDADGGTSAGAGVLLLSGNLIDIGIWIWIWDQELTCPLCITRIVCDHC